MLHIFNEWSNSYKGNKHYEHYVKVFSGVCCQTHQQGLFWITAILLPFTQQISSFIYDHWLKTFVLYWKDMPNQMIGVDDPNSQKQGEFSEKER